MYCPGCGGALAGAVEGCSACGRVLPEALRRELAGATLPGAPNASGARTGLLLDGRWRLGEPLAAGGMGEVYAATDVRLRRDVAVKVLARRFLSDDELRARFLREGQALAQLDHPHIVTVHAAGEEEGVPYLVMSRVRGRSLAAAVSEEGPLPWPAVVALGRELASALAHLHSRGFVHRDVKPPNVMRAEDGRWILLDFGILRVLERGTETALVCGTPEYMAPEQASDPTAVDGRSDLYALGGTLYHALTGRPPFEAVSAFEVLVRRRTEAPPALDGALAPPALRGLIVALLAKEPQGRPRSADEVARTLAAMASETPPAPRRAVLRSAIAVAVVLASLALGATAARFDEGLGAPPARLDGQCAPAQPLPRSAEASLSDGRAALPMGGRAVPVTGLFSAGVAGGAGKVAERTPPASAEARRVAVEGRVLSAAPGSGAAVGTEARPPPEPSLRSVRTRRLASASAEERLLGQARAATGGEGGEARPGTAASPGLLPRSAGSSAAGPPRAAALVAAAALHVVVQDALRASWARVSIDGELLGEVTTVTRSLPAGVHLVRASRPGFRELERRVELAAGARVKLRLELERL